MTRELKFRFWNGNTKEMHEQDETWDKFPLCGENECFMQFTGLKDKNGKEIYEGDVVRRWINSRGLMYPSMYKKNIITIEFKNSSWNIKPRLLDRIEIIGNVYSNPELLSN